MAEKEPAKTDLPEIELSSGLTDSHLAPLVQDPPRMAFLGMYIYTDAYFTVNKTQDSKGPKEVLQVEEIYTSDSGKSDKQIFPAKLLPSTLYHSI